MHWVAALAFACLAHSTIAVVWPQPKSYTVANTTTTFAATFDVQIPGKDFEKQVASTFTTWIRSALPNSTGSNSVTGVDVTVVKTLSFPYSYLEPSNYSITKSANATRLTVTAASTLGAIHALSTILQWAASNACPTTMAVMDQSDFVFRGLNLDVSSRWLPMTTLMSIIDGLSMSKLNVLNIRLSDDEAVRFRSDNSSSDLTDYANAFYTEVRQP
jgi:N-acetyl-beta-hexosaminidase